MWQGFLRGGLGIRGRSDPILQMRKPGPGREGPRAIQDAEGEVATGEGPAPAWPLRRSILPGHIGSGWGPGEGGAE